jgi:hypothetical protein
MEYDSKESERLKKVLERISGIKEKQEVNQWVKTRMA